MEKCFRVKIATIEKWLGEKIDLSVLDDETIDAGDLEIDLQSNLTDWVCKTKKIDLSDIQLLWFNIIGDWFFIHYRYSKHFKYGVCNLITFEVFSTNNKKAFMQEVEREIMRENANELQLTTTFNDVVESVLGFYKTLVCIERKKGVVNK